MMEERRARPRILVVDSITTRRSTLARRLRGQGYEVAECGLVAEAVAAAAEGPPQALVLEQRLRDGTALDVLEAQAATGRSGPRPFVIVHGDWPAEALPRPVPGVDVALPHPVLDRDVARLLGAYVPLERCCAMAGVRRGDHLLLLYRERRVLLDQLAMYFACGLAEGERCILACPDADAADQTRAHFERSGIDVERCERNRSLLLVTTAESYLVGGRFAPRLMQSFIRDLVAAALSDGHAGLRGAGEGVWVPHTPEDQEAWFNYEHEVQALFESCPLTALCLYDQTAFSGEMQLRALHAHPALLDGRVVCDNVYYRCPEALPFDAAAALEQRLDVVRRARRLDG